MAALTFETHAWITEYNNVTPQELQTVEGAKSLYFREFENAPAGWTLAGTAQITVTTLDHDALVMNKVFALKAEAKETRAAATKRCNEIENQIQNLMAITHQPGAK